jgi:soluble lytic murein transglycosylase
MTRSGRLTRFLWVLPLLFGGGFLAWRFYREPLRAFARDYLSFRSVDRYEDVLRVAALESDVDPCLLAAVMIAESSGRVGARSSANALGLFQLTLTSARWRAELRGMPEPSEEALLSDPLLNARLGADHLRWLLDTYDGDVERALCAYNCGPRRLKELNAAAGGWESWRDERTRSGTSQILAYAHRVLHYRDELFARGFFPEFYRPEPDELALPPTDGEIPGSSAPAATVAETSAAQPASK